MDLITEFVAELRQYGIPVSLGESIDAHEALISELIDDRELLKEALAATLIKNDTHREAFESLFNIYFGVSVEHGDTEDSEDNNKYEGEDSLLAGNTVAKSAKLSGGSSGSLTQEEVIEMLFNALLNGEKDRLNQLAKLAVSMFASIEPGRPVGGVYYLYRTLRNIDIEALQAKLKNALLKQRDKNTDENLNERFASDEATLRTEKLKKLIEDEIRQRLIEDRGKQAMAKTLKKPLLEDIDIMRASRQEMFDLQQAIVPLSRKLASRLANRRRHLRQGRLNWPATIRKSMALGGSLAEPIFKKPKISKPDIILLADLSGSVASFARFTLQLVYALSSQFTKIRSFAFIDGIDEITSYFDLTTDPMKSFYKINTEADIMWLDGHSDYGHALTDFVKKWPEAVTPKSSVLILGDARSNYHNPHSDILKQLSKKSKHVYWLNPEPKAYWDSGDSIVKEYAPFCDEVLEVRTLKQLELFVDKLD